MKRLDRWTVFAAAVLGIALNSSAEAARNLRAAPMLQLASRGGASQPMLADGRALVLVIDARLTATARVLERLAAAGFDGHGAVIVVLTDRPGTQSFARLQSQLPRAQWTAAVHADAASQLGGNTLPAIYGVDVNGEAAWKVTGLGIDADTVALRMIDWINKAPTSAPERE